MRQCLIRRTSHQTDEIIADGRHGKPLHCLLQAKPVKAAAVHGGQQFLMFCSYRVRLTRVRSMSPARFQYITGCRPV
jgi:hypothetical protein